jgi:hypothetical protein
MELYLAQIQIWLSYFSIEQSISLLLCFSLWYVVRSVFSIKKMIEDDKDRNEDFISEAKFSEERIYTKMIDFHQSHKDTTKKVILDNIEIPEDRTEELLEYLYEQDKTNCDYFHGLKKRNKDEIKLLELLRREVQEIREDNLTNLENIIFPDYSKNIDIVQNEQSKRFSKLERQINNINVNPIVKIPSQDTPIINIPKQKDYSPTLDLIISHINHIKNNPKGQNNKQTITQLMDWTRFETMLGKYSKEIKDNQQKNIPIQQVHVSPKIPHPPLPDFKQMNRDLLLQVEEAVSSRLEELNRNILNNKKSYSIEIQNTISQINKITEIVTNKLSSVKIPNTNITDNNKEVLGSISQLSIELNNLKKQVSNISREIPVPIINVSNPIKIDQIEDIFNNGKEEIKKEIKKESKIINDILIRLPLVDNIIISKLNNNIIDIAAKMKTLSYTINHIDITQKENQDKVNMLFFTHMNSLKNSIKELKSLKDINLEPIIVNLEDRFNNIDTNFDKFLEKLSNMDTDGSKYDINPESLDQIKHIFEVDIINQYNEVMLFLDLMGSKISELTIRKKEDLEK